MRRRLLKLLACPRCYTELELHDARGEDEVREGTLVCANGHPYAVTAGIPRLTISPTSGTAEHFAEEFTALSSGDHDLEDPAMTEWLFYSRTGFDASLYERFPGDPYRTEVPRGFSIDPWRLQGKVVLDAGCGPGRFIPAAAAHASLVVGLDLGSHINRAADRLSHLDNVELVQGSVIAPPFKSGVFDVVFSVGVLHHTPDPAGGCRALAATLAPGGVLSLWVYSPAYWPPGVRGVIARGIHRGVARLSPKRSWWVCARILYPVGVLQRAVDSKRWLKIVAAPVFLINVPRHPRREVMISTIHDYYGPPIISTHHEEEVERWLQLAGLTDICRLPVPVSMLGTMPAGDQ